GRHKRVVLRDLLPGVRVGLAGQQQRLGRARSLRLLGPVVVGVLVRIRYEERALLDVHERAAQPSALLRGEVETRYERLAPDAVAVVVEHRLVTEQGQDGADQRQAQ